MQMRSVTESTSPGCGNASAGAILIRGILNYTAALIYTQLRLIVK